MKHQFFTIILFAEGFWAHHRPRAAGSDSYCCHHACLVLFVFLSTVLLLSACGGVLSFF